MARRIIQFNILAISALIATFFPGGQVLAGETDQLDNLILFKTQKRERTAHISSKAKDTLISVFVK